MANTVFSKPSGRSGLNRPPLEKYVLIDPRDKRMAEIAACHLRKLEALSFPTSGQEEPPTKKLKTVPGSYPESAPSLAQARAMPSGSPIQMGSSAPARLAATEQQTSASRLEPSWRTCPGAFSSIHTDSDLNHDQTGDTDVLHRTPLVRDDPEDRWVITARPELGTDDYYHVPGSYEEEDDEWEDLGAKCNTVAAALETVKKSPSGLSL